MTSKFEKVPVEHDTKILFRKYIMLGEYEVLYEKWNWDGAYGESIIFFSKDVENLDDNQIETVVRRSPLLKSDTKITIKKLDS